MQILDSFSDAFLNQSERGSYSFTQNRNKNDYDGIMSGNVNRNKPKYLRTAKRWINCT